MTTLRTRRAFTLVELLVVMGIIVGLMALLVPAITAARARAQQGACNHQMAELAKSVFAYATKKDRFPGWRDDVGGTNVGWIGQILPFIGQEGQVEALSMYWCPSDPPTGLNSDPTKAPFPFSYACNGGATDSGNKEPGNYLNAIFHDRVNGDVRVSIEDISRKGGLSNRICLAENTNLGEWTDASSEFKQAVLVSDLSELGDPEERGKTATSAKLAVPSSYHKLGFNIAFADGHTEYFVTDADSGSQEETDMKNLYRRRMIGP